MKPKVVTAAQMRAIEEKSAELGVPPSVLMDNAGRSVARIASRLLGERRQGSVLVLIGPGNNGGDGLVAARYLVAEGREAVCYVWHRRADGDRVREEALAAGVPVITAEEDAGRDALRREVERAALIVDSLLGTGLSRPLSDELRSLLNTVRQAMTGQPVLAVDVPTGLNSDTGAVDEATLPADLTVTLGHYKAGLLVAPGAAYAGQVVLGSIGLPEGATASSTADVMDDAEIAALLPQRRPYSHKGTYGKALVVAGSSNYVGAALMASQSAYRAGAGLVTLAIARSLHPIAASRLQETTFVPLPEDAPGTLGLSALKDLLPALNGYDALLVGPGLGRHAATQAFVRELVRELPTLRDTARDLRTVILDADALNALAGTDRWWRDLGADVVITPHAAEMARLLGRSVGEVESNRIAVAQQAAREWGLVVVLKGAYTVVATPDGMVEVCPVATAALATAGSGDVLAGAALGLAAQGLAAAAAARAAVYLHARAGEMMAEEYGLAGGVAGDLIALLPRVRRSLQNSYLERGSRS